MTEKEIDLQDLLLEVLFHWRGMILWALIGGIILTVLSFFKLPPATEGIQAGQSGDLTLQELKDKMTQAELAEADHALLNEYACRKWQSYMEESALMKIDTSQVYQANLIYAVNSGRQKVNLTTLYEDLLSAGYMYGFVTSETGNITALDARELIHVADSGGSIQGQADPSFCITVTAGTRKDCRAMAKAVQTYTEKVHENVIRNYGVSHTVTLLQNHITVTGNTDLLQKQIDVRNKVNSLQSETADMIGSFSKEQTQYYQRMSENDRAAADEPAGLPERAKYAVLGMFLGMLLYIFPVSFKYILEEKLRYGDNCEELFQIPILGYIPAGWERAGTFGRIDHCLYRLQNRNRPVISTETAQELSAATVVMAAQKKGTGCVHIVGCDLALETSAKTGEVIRQALEKEGIDSLTVDQILYCADARLLLRNAEMAVMIEKAGCPLHMIFQELKVLKQQEIEISGMIIIE